MSRAFERPATIALPGSDGEAGLALEGLHVPCPEPPRAAAVIAPPHPLYGGSMDHPVVTELAHVCERAGIESLRFNWRGVGGSGGDMTGDEGIADEDYSAALDFLTESTPNLPIVACGYSFGAATALRVARARREVKQLLLVAPPPALLDRQALHDFGGRTLVAVGERDSLAPPDELERWLAGHAEATFVTIPETDHFFAAGLAALHDAARSWLDPSR